MKLYANVSEVENGSFKREGTHCLRSNYFSWMLLGNDWFFSRSLSSVHLNSIQISLLRCVIAGTVLIIMLLITDRIKLHILLKDIWMFIGTGVLGLALFNICYFISIGENTLSLASILLYTAPSFVVVMSSVLFKERITRQKLLALIISFTGCFFAVGVFGESLQTTIFGLAVGLGSGIGYGLYSIFSSIALKKYNWLTVITYTFLFASAVLLPFAKPIEIISILSNNPNVIASTISLGLFSTLLPFLLYTKGLEQLEVGKAALLTFIEPVVATIVGVVVYQEKVTIFNTGGVLLIVLSIMILNTKSNITTDQESLVE